VTDRAAARPAGRAIRKIGRLATLTAVARACKDARLTGGGTACRAGNARETSAAIGRCGVGGVGGGIEWHDTIRRRCVDRIQRGVRRTRGPQRIDAKASEHGPGRQHPNQQSNDSS
jgi:hypothetical protein